MTFIPILLMNIVMLSGIVCFTTIIGVILLIISAVMKIHQTVKKKKAEKEGYRFFHIRKFYIIPGVFGFIFMLPFLICIIVILYAGISSAVYERTSLAYNLFQLNTEQVEKIIDSGVSPDCSEESNAAAKNGEKTLLYLLADGILYEQWPLKNEPEEYVHDKTLEMMQLLIDKGADVNYAAYRAMYEECHGYTDEYSIYGDTDRCGWTPLMVATYHGDLDMIKLLVDNGADVHAVDYCGYNVINIVAAYLEDEEGYEILTYYLDKGVDPDNGTNLHQSSIWLAYRNTVGSRPYDNDKILATLEELKYGADFFEGWE